MTQIGMVKNSNIYIIALKKRGEERGERELKLDDVSDILMKTKV